MRLIIILIIALALAGCNMYQRESVTYTLTDPTEMAAPAPVSAPSDNWWAPWVTLPPDLAKILASAPVGIVHEVMGGLRGIVGGMVRIETGRAKRAVTYSRCLIGARHEIEWLKQFQFEGREALDMTGSSSRQAAQDKVISRQAAKNAKE